MPEEEPCAKPKPEREPFGWQFWLFLTVLIVILWGLTKPLNTRGANRANQTEAINNLRQIGLALHEFEKKFGEYPDEDTAALVTLKHSGLGHDLTGSSSNALFRQLFAGDIIPIR